MPRLALFRYRLPLARPLPLRDRALEARAGLLVRLEDEAGRVGWGDAAPLPGFSREPLDEAEAALRALGPPLPHPDASDAADALPPSARYALALARWDLDAQRRGVALPAVLADAPAGAVPLNGLLGGLSGNDADAVRRDAARLAAGGYRALKLKVGRGEVDREAALVRALHADLGDAVALRLDANRAWAYADAHRFADALAGTPVEYVEEPLVDPARLPDFAAATGLPVALDESVTALAPADLGGHAYAAAVVLKPTFLGGARAWALAGRALALGMTVTWSAAFESGVGLRGLVALAAASGGATPAGLDTYRWLAADVFADRLPLDAPTVDVARVLAPRAVDLDALTPVAL